MKVNPTPEVRGKVSEVSAAVPPRTITWAEYQVRSHEDIWGPGQLFFGYCDEEELTAESIEECLEELWCHTGYGDIGDLEFTAFRPWSGDAVTAWGESFADRVFDEWQELWPEEFGNFHGITNPESTGARRDEARALFRQWAERSRPWVCDEVRPRVVMTKADLIEWIKKDDPVGWAEFIGEPLKCSFCGASASNRRGVVLSTGQAQHWDYCFNGDTCFIRACEAEKAWRDKLEPPVPKAGSLVDSAPDQGVSDDDVEARSL